MKKRLFGFLKENSSISEKGNGSLESIKNFLDTRNINGIVSVDIPRLTIRIKLEYISNLLVSRN